MNRSLQLRQLEPVQLKPGMRMLAASCLRCSSSCICSKPAAGAAACQSNTSSSSSDSNSQVIAGAVHTGAQRCPALQTAPNPLAPALQASNMVDQQPLLVELLPGGPRHTIGCTRSDCAVARHGGALQSCTPCLKRNCSLVLQQELAVTAV